MTQAKSGDTVSVHYTGTLEDGSQFDSSVGAEPLEFRLGDGTLIASFENAVIGMKVGENKTVNIAADDAYGEHRAEMVEQVTRQEIPAEIDLSIGKIVQGTAPDGEQMRLTVVGMNETHVTLDGNHPLAGEDLTFELWLVKIA